MCDFFALTSMRCSDNIFHVANAAEKYIWSGTQEAEEDGLLNR